MGLPQHIMGILTRWKESPMKLESDMKSDRTFSGAFPLHVRSISVVLSQEAAILNCFLAGNVLIPLKFYLGSTKLVEPQLKLCKSPELSLKQASG